MSLSGKLVVVTGGSGTIGRPVISLLQAQDADVVVIDRVPPAGLRAIFIQADLSSSAGITEVCDVVAGLEPDILVNLAALQFFGPFEQQTPANLEAGYMVNLVGPARLARAAIIPMRSRGSGQIVNIGSIFGSISYPHFATYSSAKHGLRGLSEALRRELEGSGISVTYIAPRAVRGGLTSGRVMTFAEMTGMGMDPPEKTAQRIVRAILLKKKDVYLGLRENMFVRLNALLPRVVDMALASHTAKARGLFK